MVQAKPGPEAEAARATTLLALDLTGEAPPARPEVAAEQAESVLTAGNSIEDGVLTGPELWHATVPPLADRDRDGRVSREELIQRWIEGDRNARRREAESVLATLSSQPPSTEIAAVLNQLLLSLVASKLELSASAYALPAEDRQAMIEDARRLTKEAIQKNMVDPRIQLLVADVELQSQQTAETVEQGQQHLANAEAALRRGLELNATMPHIVDVDEWTSPIRASNPVVTQLQLQYMLGQVLLSRSVFQSEATEALLSEVRRIVTALRRSDVDGRLPLLLEFRLAMQQKDVERSAQLDLAKLLAREVGNPNLLSRDAAAMLGQTYVRFGDAGAALEIYRRQLRAEPLWVVGRVALAEVLSSLGRTEEAIAQYESVVGHPGVAERLAGILMLQQAQRPAGVRDWNRAKSVLGLAEVQATDKLRIVVLRSELMGLEALTLRQLSRDRKETALDEHAQQLLRSAEDALRAALRTHPKAVSLWTALAALLLRREELPLEERLLLVSQLIEEAKVSAGAHADFAIVELSVAQQRKQREELALAERLAGELKTFPEDGKLRLVLAMCQVFVQFEQMTQARTLLFEFAKEVPKDLDLHRTVNQALLRDFHPEDSGWESQWKENLEQITSLEGTSQGYALLAQAQRLLKESRGKSVGTETQKKVREMLAIVRKTRPYLAAVLQTQGMLEDEAGNLLAASEAYREAMLLGDHSKTLVTQLVGVLLRQNQLEEANRVLSLAANEQANVISGDLARLAWRVAERRDQYGQALEIATKAAEQDPSHRAQFDAAFLKFSRGESSDEIKQVFEKQAELAPQQPQSWSLLVFYHIQVADWDAAVQTIRDAEEHLTEKNAKNVLAVAQMWDTLATANPQFVADASRHFELAERQFPTDNNVQLLVANHFVRIKSFDRARKNLTVLVEPTRAVPLEIRAWAQRQLLSLRATSDKYQDIRGVLTELERAASTGEDKSPENSRLQITLHQRSSNMESLTQQATLFARLDTQGKLTDTERIAYAKVLERLDRWDEAEEQFRKCLETQREPVRARVEYCLALLRRADATQKLLEPEPSESVRSQLADAMRKLLETARSELDRLQLAEPGSWRTISVKARFLAQRGQTAEAVAIVTSFATARLKDRGANRIQLLLRQESARELLQTLLASTPVGEQPSMLTALSKASGLINEKKIEEAANWLSMSPAAPAFERFLIHSALDGANLLDLWDDKAAEELLIQCIAGSEGADAPRELARFYARSGRIAEAVQTCETHWDRIKPAGIAYILSLLVRAEGEVPLAQLREWRERLLAEANALPSAEQGLLYLHLGNFDNETGHHEDAIAEYAKANQSPSRRFDSLNNFAFLSARMGKNLTEATEAIEDAIQMAGGTPDLLDTKATVLLALGQLPEATSLMQDLSRERPAGPILFRLAECYYREKNATMAAEALKSAFKKGLEPDKLHPLDQAVLKELQSTVP